MRIWLSLFMSRSPCINVCMHVCIIFMHVIALARSKRRSSKLVSRTRGGGRPTTTLLPHAAVDRVRGGVAVVHSKSQFPPGGNRDLHAQPGATDGGNAGRTGEAESNNNSP